MTPIYMHLQTSTHKFPKNSQQLYNLCYLNGKPTRNLTTKLQSHALLLVLYVLYFKSVKIVNKPKNESQSKRSFTA